jgi:hypothetical protein
MGKYLENKSRGKPKQKESEECTSVLRSVAVDELWKWEHFSIFLILVLDLI